MGELEIRIVNSKFLRAVGIREFVKMAFHNHICFFAKEILKHITIILSWTNWQVVSTNIIQSSYLTSLNVLKYVVRNK